MRVWLGKLRRPNAGMAFREPVMKAKGMPDRTSLEWWRIRRLFGFSFGRVIFAVIQVEKPEWHTITSPASRKED